MAFLVVSPCVELKLLCSQEQKHDSCKHLIFSIIKICDRHMISDMCRARALSRCSSNEWAVKFVSATRRSDDKRAITYNSLNYLKRWRYRSDGKGKASAWALTSKQTLASCLLKIVIMLSRRCVERTWNETNKIYYYLFTIWTDEQQCGCVRGDDARKERTFFSIYLLEYGITNKIHSWRVAAARCPSVCLFCRTWDTINACIVKVF